MKDSLDFLVIGAQKSGTTALFEVLHEHPQIFIPAEKEAPFFSHPRRLSRGVEYLFTRWYSSADENLKWGKVTPHYMTHPDIPERIASTFPEILLVSILRDPVDRAVSHYHMMARRGWEKRSLDEAIHAQLTPRSLERARRSREPDETYVVWGEYGRILDSYLDHFRRKQLLIVFSEDFAAHPGDVFGSICDFIGVARLQPDKLGDRHHVGGRRRIPSPFELLKRSEAARRMWDSVPPQIARPLERALVAFDRWNVVPDEQAERAELSAPVREELMNHYRVDGRLLISFGVSPPWLESWRM